MMLSGIPLAAAVVAAPIRNECPVRELLLVIVACVVWGVKWTHKWVLVKTDNQYIKIT